MESETTSIGFSMWITKQQRHVKFYQRLHVSLQRCNNLLSKSKSGSSEAAYKHSSLLTMLTPMTRRGETRKTRKQ